MWRASPAPCPSQEGPSVTSISIDPGWDPARFAASFGIPPGHPWHDAMTSLPPHMFIPRWWEPVNEPDGEAWILCDGPVLAANCPGAWSAAIDTDCTVITRIGPLHADNAKPGDRPTGLPAGDNASPDDTLDLFRFADVQPGCTVLLADAASGYECALLARQLGSDSVTALADTETADRIRPRLAELGLTPALVPSPAGPCDCLISAVPGPLPIGCLADLAPGGRLAAHLPTGILVATKFPDGTALGHAMLWTENDIDIPNPFADKEPPDVVPVTVQPDGSITLRLDFTQL